MMRESEVGNCTESSDAQDVKAPSSRARRDVGRTIEIIFAQPEYAYDPIACTVVGRARWTRPEPANEEDPTLVTVVGKWNISTAVQANHAESAMTVTVVLIVTSRALQQAGVLDWDTQSTAVAEVGFAVGICVGCIVVGSRVGRLVVGPLVGCAVLGFVVGSVVG